MDYDELVQVNFYLRQLRSFRAMHSSSQQVDEIETTVKSLKTALEHLIRSKIAYASEQLIENPKCECYKWEELVCKSIYLVENAHKSIGNLLQSSNELIKCNVSMRKLLAFPTVQNEPVDEIQNGGPSNQADDETREIKSFRCGKCIKTYDNMARLYRHEFKIHGQHSKITKPKKKRSSNADSMRSEMIKQSILALINKDRTTLKLKNQ